MTNNIFFNRDTLVLSLPLITVCLTYAFFKYVPLHIGGPLVGASILFYQMIGRIRRRRAERSLTMDIDKGIMKELEGEEAKRTAKANAKSQKKERKASDKLRQRLKAENKANNNNNNGGGGEDTNANDDYDEIDAMQAFVKGGRNTSGKRRK